MKKLCGCVNTRISICYTNLNDRIASLNQFMIRHKIEQLMKKKTFSFFFGGLCLIKFLWISS